MNNYVVNYFHEYELPTCQSEKNVSILKESSDEKIRCDNGYLTNGETKRFGDSF